MAFKSIFHLCRIATKRKECALYWLADVKAWARQDVVNRGSDGQKKGCTAAEVLGKSVARSMFRAACDRTVPGLLFLVRMVWFLSGFVHDMMMNKPLEEVCCV